MGSIKLTYHSTIFKVCHYVLQVTMKSIMAVFEAVLVMLIVTTS